MDECVAEVAAQVGLPTTPVSPPPAVDAIDVTGRSVDDVVTTIETFL